MQYLLYKVQLIMGSRTWELREIKIATHWVRMEFEVACGILELPRGFSGTG
jgi:hypothetical protein